MRLMPSSRARLSTRRASSGSEGSPQMPSPVIRIAPKPMRFTSRSPPIENVPAAAAFGRMSCSVMSCSFSLSLLAHQALLGLASLDDTLRACLRPSPLQLPVLHQPCTPRAKDGVQAQVARGLEGDERGEDREQHGNQGYRAQTCPGKHKRHRQARDRNPRADKGRNDAPHRYALDNARAAQVHCGTTAQSPPRFANQPVVYYLAKLIDLRWRTRMRKTSSGNSFTISTPLAREGR